jgi:hypothetical protein
VHKIECFQRVVQNLRFLEFCKLQYSRIAAAGGEVNLALGVVSGDGREVGM